MGALRRMFGNDVEIEWKRERFSFQSAENIVLDFREGGYDEMIIVAPLSVIARVVDLGVRPLWSQAQVINDPYKADWSVKNRHYRFVEFRRVEKLVLEFSDLGPEAVRRDND
jgi:hypothetical protein